MRGRLDIYAQILRVAEEEALQDHIELKCRLNTKQTHEYIHALLRAGLLNAFSLIPQKGRCGPKRHRVSYRTSQAGKRFLELYSEMQNLLRTN